MSFWQWFLIYVAIATPVTFVIAAMMGYGLSGPQDKNEENRNG